MLGAAASFPLLLSWGHDAGVVVRLEYTQDALTPCVPRAITPDETSAPIPQDKQAYRAPPEPAQAPSTIPAKEQKAQQA